MKGHIIATDFRHTCLVQQTRQYKPLVTLVNRIARQLLPKWFTWTTMQLSCIVLTKPHQHVHHSSPWSSVFSIGTYTRGHIWVQAGCVGSGQGGWRCRMQCLDGVRRERATYNVSQLPVVVRTGAWHATCSWHGERQLVVSCSRGDWQTLLAWDRAFLHEAAFGLYAGAWWATSRSTTAAMEHRKSARARLEPAWRNIAMPSCGIWRAWSTTSTMPG